MASVCTLIKACLCPFQALAVVMSYLTDQRRGHSTILWLNLQEELALEANGLMFTPREPGCLEQPIPICVQHPRQLQVRFCSRKICSSMYYYMELKRIVFISVALTGLNNVVVGTTCMLCAMIYNTVQFTVQYSSCAVYRG